MIHLAPAAISHTLPWDGGRRGDREQDPILLEIGKRDQGNHQSGDDVAQGYRNQHQSGAQHHNDGADQALGCLGWCASADEPPSQDI